MSESKEYATKTGLMRISDDLIGTGAALDRITD